MDNKTYETGPPNKVLPPDPPPPQLKGPPSFPMWLKIVLGMSFTAIIALKCIVVFMILSASRVHPVKNEAQKEIQACIQKCFPCRSAKNYTTANLTLDPKTAHPQLYVSEDLKSVEWRNMAQNVTSTKIRYDVLASVLSQESFTSGKICWEVEVVQDGHWWAVGVADKSVQRKGSIYFAPQAGYWAVQLIGGQYESITDPKRTVLTLHKHLTKIQVLLDYSEGQVAFFDGDTDAEIFTFPQTTFKGEIYAFFLVHQSNAKLTLHP
nr:butyrophilin subfamily 2 member A2-like [Anolis sagrei ordinatus]